MRDPAENKGIEPSIGSSRASPDHDRAINDVYALIKAARDRMRVLSLTCDANDGGGYPAFDGCWSRPRMWEQHGDVHRGACLLFDRPRLECAIHEQWPDKRTYLGKVVTADGSVESVRWYVDTDRILSDEQPARAVAEHIEANRDAFFFLKSDDSPRSEYRVLLATGDDDYACIDYGDSLVYVVVGERVPEWQDRWPSRRARTRSFKSGRLDALEGGRPRVLPVRPPGPYAP